MFRLAFYLKNVWNKLAIRTLSQRERFVVEMTQLADEGDVLYIEGAYLDPALGDRLLRQVLYLRTLVEQARNQSDEDFERSHSTGVT